MYKSLRYKMKLIFGKFSWFSTNRVWWQEANDETEDFDVTDSLHLPFYEIYRDAL